MDESFNTDPARGLGPAARRASSSVRLADRTGLPSLLIYLGVGLVVGEAGLGIQFSDYEITAELGPARARADPGRGRADDPVVGGAAGPAVRGRAGDRRRRGQRRRRRGPGATCVLGVDARNAVILGSVVASTDAAAVFSVLRKLPLRPAPALGARGRVGAQRRPGRRARRARVLRRLGDDVGAARGSATVVFELLGGAVLGVALGRARARAARRGWPCRPPASTRWPPSRCACWPSPPARSCTSAASSASTWRRSCSATPRCRTGGRCSASPARRRCSPRPGCSCCSACWPRPTGCCRRCRTALLIGAAATFVARPLAVVVSALPFRMPWREQAFLSWAGLRGAVPIVIATIPVTEGLPGADARRRRRVRPRRRLHARAGADAAAGSAGGSAWSRRGTPSTSRWRSRRSSSCGADLLQVRVGPGSRLHGVYVEELRLPPGAHVTLIVRDGQQPGARPAHALRARRPGARGGDQRACATPPRRGCGPSRAAASWPAGRA